MKKFFLWFFGIIIFLIVSITVYLAFYGLFYKPTFSMQTEGGETIVITRHVGPYQLSALAMDTLYYDLLNNHDIETFKGIGTYYDNPQEVDESQLRSDVGCIIAPKDTAKLINIEPKYRIKKVDVQKYIVSNFPYKGKMSIILGVFKIYPELMKYCENNGYAIQPITEIYDINNKVIHYRLIAEKK